MSYTEENIISASGERAAIGGYLPQFDEFAWFVYLNLINKELEWIRVADPKAEKLDDIQYATYSEIHAYQMKWTTVEANISYKNFVKLLPVIVSSWKSIKAANPNKKVIPHLFTKKTLSSHDEIDKDRKIGSFDNFISEVWKKIKNKQKIDKKWTHIIDSLKKETKLNDLEFDEFISVFDFQSNYKKKDFSIENIKHSKEDEDLQQISRFIIEQVADPSRRVEFSRQEIIQKLGWGNRFKTYFNHELVIDRQKYQPIQSTIDTLNAKLTEYKNGYLFLQGGPGTGKSTLLNQWSKQLKQRVIRYYAFDFVNPSSHLNFYERGNATSLFFDLVFQLKEADIYKKNILPYKDILFLKETFAEQLKSLGENYLKTQQSTIIIIDGLDHVPREYKSVTNSFLRELPLPASLPEGVFIVLGSQTYDLEDIQQEIKTEFKRGNRTILIDSLKKKEVYKYIDATYISTQLTISQKQQIFEKSQGHPLYLSYLIEKIDESDSVDEIIESFDVIEGDIENYYRKIWNPIQQEENLVQLLGLISRIKGSVNLLFVNEWGFDNSVLKLFREKAKVLFNDTEKTLSFFHNSFRQFLLYHTAINYLTDEFDSNIELNYHNQLAEFYKKSTIEKSWRQNYHLFQAKKYDEFISLATPDSFTGQLLNYRPVEEIKQDAKLGIEIAKQTKNVNILIRYLFALAEIERRLFNVNPASFTEELLKLNNFNAASNYLRTENVLHCSKVYAFKASRLFYQYNHKKEALILYNLAYPEVITNAGIIIDDSHRYEEIKEELKEWIRVTPYFEATENILTKIEKIVFEEDIKGNRFDEDESDLYMSLLVDLGYSLIEQNKWKDFNFVLNKIDIDTSRGRSILFELTQYAIEQCLDLDDSNRANDYLLLIKNHFIKEDTKPLGRINIANLIYKVTGDKEETLNWIKDIEQALNIAPKHFDYGSSLDDFLPLIRLNKLLNLCGNGISITSAVLPAKKGSDEEVLVEFQRMLCLIAKIQTDGMLQNTPTEDIIKRTLPIIRFYYKNVSHRNMHWYKLTQCKSEYFDFLIYAVSRLGNKELNALSEYLFNEFKNTPKYWNEKIKRKIIISLFNNGLDIEIAKTYLLSLEENPMLEGHDIDGRINECVEHSNAWFSLGQPEKAEKWMKQAIQESIGIGYRKDYQFSSWISWLRKVNKADSENAPERIKWFLSHLRHIKETTEGRAYWNASEELLEATFEHNLNDGFQQTIWQLNHDLIDFCDSISLFIKYFTERVQNEEEFVSIVQLYTHLYLLLSEQRDLQLLKCILSRGYEVSNEHFLRNHIGNIILAINIKAYEDDRYYLLSEIDEFLLSKGIKTVDYYPDFKISNEKRRPSSSESSNTLVFSEQKRLSESEVIEKSVDFEGLKKILQKESPDSYFKWSKVLDKITPSLSVFQIEEISNIDKKGRRDSDFYASLSKAAFEKGAVGLAKKLAESSLDMSRDSGWVKNYDGGSRIEAFSALRKIDPKASAEKAFEVFAYDITSTNANLYIEEVEDIIPFLTTSYNVEDVWNEIFSYLKRLMANSKPIEELPIIFSINKPIMETLVDYLMYLSNSPVSVIKKQSILLLVKYIDQNNKYTLNRILNENEDDYLILEIIIALFESKSPQTNDFIVRAKELSISKDYHLRDNARRILYILGKTIPKPKTIELPAIYSLHLSEPPKPDFNKEIDIYIPDVDVNDSRDLIRPFEFFIDVLSEESGIDKYNLTLRAYSIMKEIGKIEEWTNEYEKGLRNHLEEINLKYSYPRPRAIAAQKAIMHVVAELIDAEIIYEDARINSLFKLYDYAVPFFKEVPKPSFIQTVKEKEYGGVSSNWLDRIDESPRLTELLLNYKQDFNIIAEYTKIKNLDWGVPTEEYMWQIAIDDEINKQDYYIFGSLFHQLSCNYHYLTGGGHSIIVIREHRYNQFSLKSRWIAINPALARYLGWKPEPSKLFAWKDSNGELMAESIYWVNGNIDMVPRKNGEVGEGWFVIISKAGLEQIKNVELNLFVQKKLIRTQSEDSILMDSQIFNVMKI
jgi:hypothetical protein